MAWTPGSIHHWISYWAGPRRPSFKALLLGCLLALVPGLSAEDLGFTPGTLHAQVRCLGDPAFSYALYLPSAYSPKRTWPVLFAFSPSGQGADPVKIFQPAAERLGWIVVGSLEARNGPLEPILAAQAALWKDVHQRFKVASDRRYATGFSGGSRVAQRLAQDHPNGIAGVISIGAFFPTTPLALESRRGQVLLSGEDDFNHWEMLRAEQILGRARVPHWQESFPGGHQWMPPEWAEAALDWLEVLAMRQGRIPNNDAFIQGAAERSMVKAQALEAQGQVVGALRKYRAIAEGFPSRATQARAQERRLEKDPRVQGVLALEAEYGDLKDALLAATTAGARLTLVKRCLSEVDFAGERGRFSRTILGEQGALMGTEAQAAYQEQQWSRAAGLYEAAATFLPKNPVLAYNAGCAHALAGHPDPACQWVAEAIRRGFANRDLLQQDEDLKTLRGRPCYEALKAMLKPKQGVN